MLSDSFQMFALPENTKSKNKDTVNKRGRTQFQPYQLNQLMKEFEKNSYVNQQRRDFLAKQLGLTQRQVKVWFQNARMKSKQLKKKKSAQNLPSYHNFRLISENNDKETVDRLLSYSRVAKIVENRPPTYRCEYWASPPLSQLHSNQTQYQEINYENMNLMEMDDFDLILQVIGEDEVQQIVERITQEIL